MASKVFILGALLCTATLGSIQAQTKDLQFGIKGGVGISHNTLESSLSKSSRVGLQFGGVIIQPISDTFSMQYEAIYSQKGRILSQTIENTNYKHETNLDYLEIPILTKFKLNNKWTLYGGGYAGIALSKKIKITTGSVSGEIDLSDNVTNNLDYGFLFGGQVNITDKWQIDARYTLGLADVFKTDNGNLDSKNSTLAIAATYLL
jgi:opacity protein-like surface antigen